MGNNTWRLSRGALAARATLIFATLLSTASAAPLPWPEFTGQLILPLGMTWQMSDARSFMVGFGQPVCQQNSCTWATEHEGGMVFIIQNYRNARLTGLHLTYILQADYAQAYQQLVGQLREQLHEWIIEEDPLTTLISTSRQFTARSPDSSIRVDYRAGEHSITVTVELQAN